MRIALIDYRAGNLSSVRKALTAVGAEVFSPTSPEMLEQAHGVIVPGVGHFQATAAIDPAWRRAIVGGVEVGRPLLGICLGLQWLCDGSEEAPALPGLGLMEGRCFLLPSRQSSDVISTRADVIKVPHVGWNRLNMVRSASLLDSVKDGAQVYFTHSYAAPVTPDAAATTTHGETFASVVERGAVFAVQFHPEKSGDVGLQILRNFLAHCGEFS